MATDDDKARKKRANRLRKEIEQLRSTPKDPEEETSKEMQPDESPKEYVERRMREISHKKPPDK